MPHICFFDRLLDEGELEPGHLAPDPSLQERIRSASTCADMTASTPDLTDSRSRAVQSDRSFPARGRRSRRRTKPVRVRPEFHRGGPGGAEAS